MFKDWKLALVNVSFSRAHNDKIVIDSTLTAVKAFRSMWEEDLINFQEQFCVILLNKENEAIGFRCLHTASFNQ